MHIYLECKLLPSFLCYSFKLQNNYEMDDMLQQTIKSMESRQLDSTITLSYMIMIMSTYIATLTQLILLNCLGLFCVFLYLKLAIVYRRIVKCQDK